MNKRKGNQSPKNERPSAREAGGSGAAEGEVAFSESSGPRKVSAFGASVDSIGRSFPQNHTPETIWLQLVAFLNGTLSWDEWTRSHQTSYEEARAVVSADSADDRFDSTEGWLASTVPMTAENEAMDTQYWIDRYGCAPLNPQIIDRLAYFAHDATASEWDPRQNIEPQVFMLGMLTPLFVECCNFHFAYLASVDEMYHANITDGKQGRFNSAKEETAFYNLYNYWRNVLDETYVSSNAITLPSHLKSSSWTIMDVLTELMNEMTSDGATLHSDLILTTKGFLQARAGASLGVLNISSHMDSSSQTRFYGPQWALASDIASAPEVDLPDAEIMASAGLAAYEIGSYDGAKVGNASAMSHRSHGVKHVKLGDYWNAMAGFDASTGSSHGYNASTLENKEYPTGLTPEIVSLGSTDHLTQQGRGYMLNLVDLIALYRKIGRQIEPTVLEFVAAQGRISSGADLAAPPVGLNLHDYVTLYNAYTAKFMFNENPSRFYTAAHMGPRDETFKGLIGEVEVDTGSKTLAEKYWTPPALSDDQLSELVQAYMPGVSYTLTTGGEITFGDLNGAGMIDNDMMARTFGYNHSLLTKQEKPVVLPAGVTGAEGVALSGADQSTAQSIIFEVVHGALGGIPHFGTGYIPWTDVQLNDDDTLASDVDVSGGSAITGRKSFLVTKKSDNDYKGIEHIASTLTSISADAPAFLVEDGVGEGVYGSDKVLSSPVSLPAFSETIAGNTMERDSPNMIATIDGTKVDAMSFYSAITGQGDESWQLLPYASNSAWGVGSGSLYVLDDTRTLTENDMKLHNQIAQIHYLELESAEIGDVDDLAGATGVDLEHMTNFQPCLSESTASEGRVWGRWGVPGLDLVSKMGSTPVDRVADHSGGITNGLSNGSQLYAPPQSVHETVIGAVNAALASGAELEYGEMTYQGVTYTKVDVVLKAKFTRSLLTSTGGDPYKGEMDSVETRNTSMAYRLLWKKFDGRDSDGNIGNTLFSDTNGNGMEVAVTTNWKKVGADGGGRPFTYGRPNEKFEWAVIALPTSLIGQNTNDGRIGSNEPVGFAPNWDGDNYVEDVQKPYENSAKPSTFTPYSTQWVWPGDDRLVGVGGGQPLGPSGSAIALDHADRLVAAGQTALFRDTSEMRRLGGSGQYLDLETRIHVTSETLGLRRFVGQDSLYDTMKEVRVISTLATGNGRTYAQAATLYGAGRDTCAVIVPDMPDNRAIWRPQRVVVDAAIEAERGRVLVPFEEEYSPEGGALGIKYIGQERPFRMHTLIVSGDYPKQYLLEQAMFRTRMVDPANRGILTFGRTRMLEDDNTMRLSKVSEEINASFPFRAGSYASSAGNTRVYTTALIRDIQLGRQRQTWTQ